MMQMSVMNDQRMSPWFKPPKIYSEPQIIMQQQQNKKKENVKKNANITT